MKTKATELKPEYGLLTMAMEIRDRLDDWDRQDSELSDALSLLDPSERDSHAEENTRLAILAKRSRAIAEIINAETNPAAPDLLKALQQINTRLIAPAIDTQTLVEMRGVAQRAIEQAEGRAE